MTTDQPARNDTLTMNAHSENHLAGHVFSREDLTASVKLGQYVTHERLPVTDEDIAAAIWRLSLEKPGQRLPTYEGIIAGKPYRLKIGTFNRPHFVSTGYERYMPTATQFAADAMRYCDRTALEKAISEAVARKELPAGCTAMTLLELSWRCGSIGNKETARLRASLHKQTIELVVETKAPGGQYAVLAIERQTATVLRVLYALGRGLRWLFSSYGSAALELKGERTATNKHSSP